MMTAKKKRAKKTGARRQANKVYLPKKGSQVSKVQAQRLGTAIDRLKKKGTNVAKALVAAARDPKSAMHGDFEWDDSKAAERYRVDQARHYVRSIEIKIIVNKTPVQTRAFVPTFRADGEIVSIGTALEDVNIMERWLTEAKRDADIFRKKYEALRELVELAGLFKEIDQFADAAE